MAKKDPRVDACLNKLSGRAVSLNSGVKDPDAE
jgi:hypothetical protein